MIRQEEIAFVIDAQDDENFEREYNGLLEAMRHLGIKEGSIVTLNQRS